MSTEAELVLMSLTNEELDDAVRWLEYNLDRWRAHVRAAEDDRSREAFGHGTDGPIHLIRAMDLAIIRERALRGGAVEWFAGMTLDGHPAASYVRHYQERISLNPDEGQKPRLAAAGIVEKVCIGCGEARPLTVAHWGWLGRSLDDYCRPCRAGKGPTASVPVLLEAEAPPVPVEAFTAAELDELADDPLALL